MEIYPSRQQFNSFPAADALLSCIESNAKTLNLGDSIIYAGFPRYRDDEDGLLVADAMLLSRTHGVVAFALTNSQNRIGVDEMQRWIPIIEQLPSYIHSRLIRNKRLRKSATKLHFDISPVVFAPFLKQKLGFDEISCDLIDSTHGLTEWLQSRSTNALNDNLFKELVSTIEGAKGLVRPKPRSLATDDESSKGRQAELVEAAITNFDQRQKHGYMGRVQGPQRLRGLAGSGKTVVLAMMAAQMHLQYPDAKIAFTFNTKSLYQHVKRLVTRFYRQFDDRDPDWDNRLVVLHGWGGGSAKGLYYEACEQHGVHALSYREAASRSIGDSFDYACNLLLQTTAIHPIYDYIFVDEGQDFPMSFIRLCYGLAKEGKFVLAYDELQSLFQTTSPSTVEIFGANTDGTPKAEFEEDIVLQKCYRNPREIIVCAHALGFGVYGERPVQMLENAEHWEDIGYRIVSGQLQEGSKVTLERPVENSLSVISDASGMDEIVVGVAFDTWEKEVAFVVEGIVSDIAAGLRPEDILVIAVDDRNAKKYLNDVEAGLHLRRVKSNNLTGDSFGIQDFSHDDRVTLSTVYKAKGNEAFMVYVMGVDSAMFRPDVRKRNMLFTAMTRAKGWVRISGVGEGATSFCNELLTAKSHFPQIVFDYPSELTLKVMKRDLADSADKKLKARRLLEQLREELTDEEFEELLKEESKAKPRKGTLKGNKR